MFDRPPGRGRAAWLAVLLMLGLVLAALWLALPTVAGVVLRQRLEALGVPDPRLTVAAIGFARARIVGVRLGAADEARADAIELDYTLPGIVGGRFEAARIAGLRLDLTMAGDRPLLGSLDAAVQALAGEGPAGGRAPIPPIVLEGATATIASPVGVVEVDLSGPLTPAASGIAAHLDLAIRSPLARFAGRLAGTLGEDGTIEGRLDIDEGDAAAPGLRIGEAGGAADFVVAGGRLRRIAARLDLADITGGGLGALAGTLAADGSAERLDLRLALRDSLGSLSGRVDATLRDFRALTASAGLELAAASPLWTIAGLPQPESGRLGLGLVLDAPDLAALARLDPHRPIAGGAAGAESLHGGITVDATGLAWPGLAREVSLAGGFDVGAPGGVPTLTAPAEWLGEARLEPQVVERMALPPELRAVAAGLLSVTLATPFTLHLEPQAEGVRASGDATLSLATAGAETARLSLAGRVSLDGLGRVKDFACERATISAGGLRYGGAQVANAALAASLAGTPDLVTGTLSAAAEIPAWRSASAAADGIALALGGEIEYSAGTFSMALGPDSRLSLRRLRSGDVALAAPVDLPLASEQVALTAAFDGEGLARLAHDLRVGPARLRLRAAETDVEIRLPRLGLAGAWERGSGYGGTARLAGGTLSAPGQRLTASKVAADLTFGPGGTLRAVYRIGEIVREDEAAVLPPLRLEGTARREGDRATFEATLGDMGGRIKLTVSGRHALASGRGQARVELAPITFASGGLQPGDLLPAASARISEAEGTIALAGDLGWGAGGITSKVELLLRELSFVTPQAAVSRLNGVIAFDRLAPLSTPPGQQIAIAVVDAGLPFTNGLITFRIEPGPVVAVEGAQLELAGGRVSLKPVRIDLASPHRELQLDVAGVDLATLLALAEVEGLTGTGRMSGRIPVVIDADSFVIAHGILESDAPGELRYKPAQAPGGLQSGGESVQLALSALTNFHYRELRLAIDRDAAGEMAVLMHVTGSNPDFYDGYPVELNLNVTGRLDEILRRGLVGYHLPETIRENLKTFGGP